MTSQQEEQCQLEQLMALFNQVFSSRYQTLLVRGDDEPIYLPADEHNAYHRVVFAHGYFASALHEVSHWCIAGARRRLLEDYGYWYMPDGRDDSAQEAFEAAEIAPQAIEKILTLACGRRFNVSVDNLEGSAEVDRDAFAARVEAKRQHYLIHGLPTRAEAFRQSLKALFSEGQSPEQAARCAGEWLDQQMAVC
ncbi:elongation factor P hydroxylase [Kushneria pakistanensis]|uniref:Elongation factor P hydroxylase n=1 Tax=Kushneria pakistanensis TaxID=1508770 RepID=A0ABQ3FPE7_9GAMM|nr:elongation factor P hydroxylase [Kushneria pakistanensis]GHC31520.1 elongation factor P hydroxylase [Kushneria pakistanensis]